MPHPPTASRRPRRAPAERNRFAWVLLACLVMLAALAAPFFLRRVYVHDDLGAFHLPLRDFYARALAAGDDFDWTEQLYAGFYVTGEGQAGTYHPLHLLLYRYLSLRAAFCLEILLSYPVMLAGMYFFLRRHIRPRDAALMGSLIFTFSGFNLLHFMHVNAVAVVAHVPWLLWAIDVAMRDGRRGRIIGAEVAVALLTASQLLLGYPQYVWFSLLAETAYVVFLCVLHKKERPVGNALRGVPGATLARLTGLKLLGAVIGAVQLVPTMDSLHNSVRETVDAGFTNYGSLAPQNLVQLVGPYLFESRVAGGNTHELGTYIGAMPLVLAAWIIIQRHRLGLLRPLAVATMILAAVALLLALGEYGPLYRWQAHLPLAGKFRCPSRAIVLFHLSMAVAAAIGFSLLVRKNRVPVAASRLWPLWSLVAASVVVAVAGPWWFAGRVADGGHVWIGPVVMTLSAVAVFAASRYRPAAIAVVLLAAVDLGVYGLSYSVYPHTARIDDYVAAVAPPPNDVSPRVVVQREPPSPLGPFVGNQILLAGARRLHGYTGLPPARVLDYTQPAALRAAGVRWIAPSPEDRTDDAPAGSDSHWQAVADPLPPAYLVARVRHSHAPQVDIERIDLATTALVDQPLEIPAGQGGTATVTVDRPGHLEITTDCPSRQLLVITQRHHQGWQAEIDGQPAEVIRVNGDFLGCVVDAGRRHVVLRFRPASLNVGKSMTGYGLGLLLFFALIRWGTFLKRYAREPR